MKFKYIALSLAVSLVVVSTPSFASDAPGKFLVTPAPEAKFYPANPDALKTILEHPSYCSIYAGQNVEPDALSNEYYQAVARLIPPQADMNGVRDILASVKTACLFRLLSVSN